VRIQQQHRLGRQEIGTTTTTIINYDDINDKKINSNVDNKINNINDNDINTNNKD